MENVLLSIRRVVLLPTGRRIKRVLETSSLQLADSKKKDCKPKEIKTIAQAERRTRKWRIQT